jgi:hypothetical protein
MKYFDKLPLVNYNNNMVRNIVTRAGFSDATKNDTSLFQPYTIEDSDRVDVLSNLYYDAPNYTWLIWLSNNIIDPYYDYPLDNNEFNDYIVNKYGSQAAASRYIAYYRTNGKSSNEKLTESQFEALPSNYKKYYVPGTVPNGFTTGYVRDREEVRLSTNKVINIAVSNTSGSFTVGEEIRVNSNNYGYATFSNSTVVTVKHVTGTFSANNTINGRFSNTTAVVVTSTEVANTIAATEGQFWEPVSYYVDEFENNENKKRIKLMDARFAQRAENELRKIMRQ